MAALWIGTAGAWAQGVPIPTAGHIKAIALRIQFVPDAPPLDANGVAIGAQRPPTRFQAQQNMDYFKDALSRARSYFLEVSGGKLDITFTVASVVATERTWDKDENYYGDDNAVVARTSELMQRAITLSESQVDFRQYDLVVVFHAGQGQESDFGDRDDTLILSRGMPTPLTGSGKAFAGAVLQAAWEMPPATGEQLSIVGRLCMGVMGVLGSGAIRTGQGIGIPTDDTYVGYWDLMDRGWMLGPTLGGSGRPDWSSPAHPNPAEKARMGWLTPVMMKDNIPNAEITQVETGGPVYRMWGEGKSGPEYFLVENRQKVGFDGYLPEAGLLVWKINEGLLNQIDAQQLRIALLQADGRQDIENQQNPGDTSDPFPGQLARKSISDQTVPSMRDSNGVSTGCSITEIGAAAQTMTANLYVVPPMILSFKPRMNFITESVTPTFRATFSENVDANSITVLVDDRIVVSQTNLATYYNAATRELTYRSAQLAFGQHVIVVSVKNTTKTVSESTGNRVFRVNFRTIPAGLRMVSIPYLLTAPANTPQSVFGTTSGTLARWVPTKGEYRYWPQHPEAGLNPPADDPQNPGFIFSNPPAGLGYWIKLGTDSPVTVTGDQIEDVEVRLPLFAGWNMIGDPFPFSVDWNGVQVEYQGQTKTLGDAVTANWINATLYTYAPGGYTWVTAPAGQIKPWEGYWVKAKVTCWLRVPPIQSGISGLSAARADAGMAGRGAATAKEWRIRLCAAAEGAESDNFNYIGVSSTAKDGADAGDVEEPPAPGGSAVLRLIEGGRALAQDLRSPGVPGAKTWQIEVVAPAGQKSVTLSWPDLTGLPRGFDAVLEDEATGRKVSMRTQAGYPFNSGDGGARRFRVTVKSRQETSLAITDLAITRTRGVPSIRLSLSRDAALTVVALDPSGRRQRTLVSEQAGRAGMNVVSTGRADGLEPGVHLVEVRATASDGTTVRAVRPFIVLRN